MSEQSFEWTDELVSEFIHFAIAPGSRSDVFKHIKDFKETIASRSPQSREWEIVELKHRGCIHKLMEWQKYRCYTQPTFEGPGQQISLSWALEPKNECNIHAVKRLSDGEVFRVGDEVTALLNGCPRFVFTIEKFEIRGKEMRIDGQQVSKEFVNWTLKSIQKAAKPDPPKVPLFLYPSEIEKVKNWIKTL